MTESQTSPKMAIRKACERLGQSAFLFGITFFVGILALMGLLDPSRFPVRIGDKVVKLKELKAEQQALLTQEQELKKGTESPVSTPALDLLKNIKAASIPVGASLQDVLRVRQSFSLGFRDPVQISSANFNQGTLTITGVIVDPESVRLLASFVDALRALPSIASVKEPEYQSTTAADGTISSPFNITLTLKTHG